MISIDIKELIQKDASFNEVKRAFTEEGKTEIYGLSGSQKAFWLAATTQDIDKPIIIVTENKQIKEQWQSDLSFLCPTLLQYNFPIMDKISFNATAKSFEIQAKAMAALSSLLEQDKCVVIATIEEASQQIISPTSIRNWAIKLNLGEITNHAELLKKLVELGYERCDQVETRGHFAVRGDIVDIFAVNYHDPIRIEFFGDEVDSIRTFSVDTQRSIDNIKSCSILPLKVNIDDCEINSLLSYGGDGLIIFDNHQRIYEALNGYLKEKREHEETNLAWRHLMESIEVKSTIFFNFMPKKVPYISLKKSIGLTAKVMTSFERQMSIFLEEVQHWLKNKQNIIIVIKNQQRREAICNLLKENNIPFNVDLNKLIDKNIANIQIVEGLLTDGFEMIYSNLVVVTEGNIFGQQKKKLLKNKKRQEINYFTDLNIGDYVVHDVHGIGKYVGIKLLEVDGISRYYLEIEYAGTDRLYLPTDKLMSLQKYIGNEGDTPRLHRMGGGEWHKIRNKAQKSINDLAEDLVKLYAEREVVKGYAFLPDDPWQREFEDAFPYEETPDQLQATAEIKASMEDDKPMDRLLCGDVGFGKTEVAMRAAFKAVMSRKQVAVLVPTTILSQQHFQTFIQRFAQFGVKVEVLNRFKSTAEKKNIISNVQDGSVDVLIGTHALLNKKIKFKDIGLLIVDEEQRFGVAQKEKWKTWAKNIDVLTLSATPIPRTLHMSLVGVRQMSVLNTPPEDRLPVQTYVAEYDLRLVIDAIQREIFRGGQVFIVYNRIDSIYRIAGAIETMLPELRYAIAHGQMSGTEIEGIMEDFYGGHYDVLISTSIIENGLDIPNANTIIVYEADKLGLSQLYQMRGRVGRSAKRAYAYFLYNADKILSETAEKRLQAMKDFTELGAGFKIAMRDLEIRGAGSILGAKQHGNIASVGFVQYCMMLEEAIAKAQNKEFIKPENHEIVINLKINAFIDDQYIPDSGKKITMYQKLLRVNSIEMLDDFVDELIDRFGTPNKNVENLIALAYIKERARNLGISSIIAGRNVLTIIWGDDSKMKNWNASLVDKKIINRMKFKEAKPTTLQISLKDEVEDELINLTKTVLTELEKR